MVTLLHFRRRQWIINIGRSFEKKNNGADSIPAEPGGGIILENHETVKKLLKGAGLRNTKQRIRVLELLLEQGVPLSHSEISGLLGEPMDKVTLYRTLQTLQSVGIVHQVQGLDGVWRFCAHDPGVEGCPGDHPHFLCLSCGKMTCMTDQQLPHVDVPEGVEVGGKQLVIYGTCRDCLKANKSGKKS